MNFLNIVFVMIFSLLFITIGLAAAKGQNYNKTSPPAESSSQGNKNKSPKTPPNPTRTDTTNQPDPPKKPKSGPPRNSGTPEYFQNEEINRYFDSVEKKK